MKAEQEKKQSKDANQTSENKPTIVTLTTEEDETKKKDTVFKWADNRIPPSPLRVNEKLNKYQVATTKIRELARSCRNEEYKELQQNQINPRMSYSINVSSLTSQKAIQYQSQNNIKCSTAKNKKEHHSRLEEEESTCIEDSTEKGGRIMLNSASMTQNSIVGKKIWQVRPVTSQPLNLISEQARDFRKSFNAE